MTFGPATKTVSFAYDGDDTRSQLDVRVTVTASYFMTRVIESGFKYTYTVNSFGVTVFVSVWDDCLDDHCHLASQTILFPKDYRERAHFVRNGIDEFIRNHPASLCIRLNHERYASPEIVNDILGDDDSSDNILMQIDQVLGGYDAESTHDDDCRDMLCDIQELISKWQNAQNDK